MLGAGSGAKARFPYSAAAPAGPGNSGGHAGRCSLKTMFCNLKMGVPPVGVERRLDAAWLVESGILRDLACSGLTAELVLPL